MSKFVILQFYDGISALLMQCQISVCIIVASFHPPSIFICVTAGGIPAPFKNSWLSVRIHVVFRCLIPKEIVLIAHICTAKVLSDHRIPI